MWLLENEETFKERRLWLRPGNTYLFGRTAAEPGQLAISHNTISRKHLTITVAPVGEGQSQQLSSRSGLTIEDLSTKTGTEVDGNKIKGSKYVVTDSCVHFIMGKCPSKFRIQWFPVVLTFSFTSKELQTQPLTSLRERFEKLDIKLLIDYVPDHTTHVVAKKRNTAKGLQALIYAKYIVTESFLDAISQAAEPSQIDGLPESSVLESDFDRYWPDPMQHLPPRGGEPVQHPDAIYAPDTGRKDVFDGYTFIFYDRTQYNNLLAPITNGCGKAMLRPITAGQESADDFVRYVKGVAGEKGLGCFDDGSEGKGAVVVRYLPGKGNMVGWYTDFITAVSLRLDHRPIEQNEFLEAILTRDASKLRRPLEVENSPPAPSSTLRAEDSSNVGCPETGSGTGEHHRRRPRPQADDDEEEEEEQQQQQQQQPPEPATAPRRGVNRRPVKKRFAGFDDGMDLDVDEASPPAKAMKPPAPPPEPEDEGGLFVSQQSDISQTLQATDSSNPARKRKASRLGEDDNLMDGMAPAAARFKRQRLERGGNAFASPSPEPAPPAAGTRPEKQRPNEMDVLAMAARHREEEEARARAEREDLAQLPDGVDLAEIRRLNIVEEMEVRRPASGRSAGRTREQDIAEGRWNPRWNGVKNFKKFTPSRVIVPLTQVKDKEFGVGDDYWLEEKEPSRPPPGGNRQAQVQKQAEERRASVVAESEDDEEVSLVRRRRRRPADTTASTQQDTDTISQARRRKRQVAVEDGAQRGSKRRRTATATTTTTASEVAASDDSDDELKFQFGRRR
ncbi:hypothetical protein L249_7825 [Ophiocordyceps polyrhachis-furcata BCC 54312]|uniref:FHA domain-containing protein n=1 Tax=Ophiocordyceps polyrhachis-furcata BCC 54312 TaxID=1330021 RepID=A0A367L0W4_9HYPO|nr:hypothetical protein L249_7825 [Ophiocordyceps polyrhachis-furcata BCC 54312]